MKLLFDQNISFRITKILSNHFPDAKQVRELKLENCTDSEIWLRIGNTSTDNTAKILLDNRELISEFIHSPSHSDISCLEID